MGTEKDCEHGAPFIHDVTAHDDAGLVEGTACEGLRLAGGITPSGEVGLTHSGATPEMAQFVDQRRADGGNSRSERGPGGGLSLTVTAGYPIGRPAEPEVARILVERLRQEGRDVELGPGVDADGEDGSLLEGGRTYDLQVITGIAAREFWTDRARMDSASTQVSASAEVAWVRGALTKKAELYRNRSQLSGTILAIDYRFSPLTPPTVAQAYRETFGAPLTEFGFREVWLIGHAPSHCTNL